MVGTALPDLAVRRLERSEDSLTYDIDICGSLKFCPTGRLGIRGTGTGQNFVTLVTPWTKSLNSDFGHIPRRITRCDIRSPSRDMFQTSVTQVTDADLSQTL